MSFVWKIEEIKLYEKQRVFCFFIFCFIIGHTIMTNTWEKQFNEEGVDAHIYIQGLGKGKCVPILLPVWQIENHGRLGIVGHTCYLCDDFREEAERGMDQVHPLQACLQWSTSSTKALSPACYHFTTMTSNYQSSNQLTMSWGSTLPHVRLYWLPHFQTKTSLNFLP